jgi:hypothetical protein
MLAKHSEYLKMIKPKPTVHLFRMFLLTILLAGCNSLNPNAGQANPGESPSSTQGVIRVDYQNALPIGTQLALGIFKLESVNAPLSKEQAAALLPLWKAYRNLTKSDTSAAEEINGLVDQVQETLDEQQLQSIAAMQLTGRDLAQLAQQENISLGFNSGFNPSPELQATRQAQRSSGQSRDTEGGFRFEGGAGGFGPGGGGFGQPPGLAQTPGALQTAIAQRGGTNTSGHVNPALVEALIAFLNTITQP